jgi:hypothetical protein
MKTSKWHQIQMSGQLHAPAALLPGKETLVPIGGKAAKGPHIIIS